MCLLSHPGDILSRLWLDHLAYFGISICSTPLFSSVSCAGSSLHPNKISVCCMTEALMSFVLFELLFWQVTNRYPFSIHTHTLHNGMWWPDASFQLLCTVHTVAITLKLLSTSSDILAQTDNLLRNLILYLYMAT